MNVANAGQSDFWNTQPGELWARFQPDLDAMHDGVLDHLIAVCDPQPGERVLDIGCGAGASTFALAGAVTGSGHVDGLDISVPLVARADERRLAKRMTNVRFLVGDAQDYSLPPESYDLVTSRFGIMFFADPVAAFRNIAASMKPGGRIVLAAWSGPEHNPWFARPQKIAAARCTFSMNSRA